MEIWERVIIRVKCICVSMLKALKTQIKTMKYKAYALLVLSFLIKNRDFPIGSLRTRYGGSGNCQPIQ